MSRFHILTGEHSRWTLYIFARYVEMPLLVWTRAFPHEYRLISQEEAKQIVSECGRLGVWQMVFVHCPVNQENEKGNEYVICNCCTCGCVPYILNRELGQRLYPLLRGDYLACIDMNAAPVTGTAWLPVLSAFWHWPMAKCGWAGLCFGCGRCVTACPEQAIVMHRT